MLIGFATTPQLIQMPNDITTHLKCITHTYRLSLVHLSSRKKVRLKRRERRRKRKRKNRGPKRRREAIPKRRTNRSKGPVLGYSGPNPFIICITNTVGFCRTAINYSP